VKILVSIVNYCDPEFYSTVKSLWETAKNKNNLFFSLVSEDLVLYDFSFIPKDQIVYRHFDISEYRGGLGWARNLATKVNFDYDFFVQFDSHTYGSKDWDELSYIKYLEIAKNDNKFIICYAPAAYELTNSGKVDFNVDNLISKFAFAYNDLIPGFNFPGYLILDIDCVVISYWATCCFLFAPKLWVDEVGISQHESFNTEEFSLSLRTFAHGWNIYSIGTRDVFHHESHKQINGTVTRQIFRPWADDRKEDYWSHVEKSTDRLSLLMSGNLDVSKNKVKEFFEQTGISKKYLEFIPNYSSHTIIKNRGFGMPPRQDK